MCVVLSSGRLDTNTEQCLTGSGFSRNDNCMYVMLSSGGLNTNTKTCFTGSGTQSHVLLPLEV